MHMHATASDGMHQNGLIRKFAFVEQLWREASLPEHLA